MAERALAWFFCIGFFTVAVAFFLFFTSWFYANVALVLNPDAPGNWRLFGMCLAGVGAWVPFKAGVGAAIDLGKPTEGP